MLALVQFYFGVMDLASFQEGGSFLSSMESAVSVKSTYHNNTAHLTSLFSVLPADPIWWKRSLVEEKRKNILFIYFVFSVTGDDDSHSENDGWQTRIIEVRSKLSKENPSTHHLKAYICHALHA